MTFIALWFAFQAGLMPNDQMVSYPVPQVAIAVNSPTSYTDLEAELRFLNGAAFVGGSIKTEMQKAAENFSFLPESSTYSFRAGLRFDGFEIGWLHVCAHPTLPYYYALEPVISFDRAYDDVYIRFSGSVPILKQ